MARGRFAKESVSKVSVAAYHRGMIRHVHDALAQVRDIHRHMVEKQRFKGYSGRARAATGCVALAGSAWLSGHPDVGRGGQLVVWGAVAAIALAIDYGAVLIWFLGNPAGERNAARLKPLLEVVPALAVGALLTAAFIRGGLVRQLPGMWMLLFGLANLASRRVVARGLGWVGLYYLAAGCYFLFAVPATAWPMGLVFFVGEWAGGLVLHFDRPAGATWTGFLGFNATRETDEQTD